MSSGVTRYDSLTALTQGEKSQSLSAGFGLALGVFDGIHLGHQAVIDAARGEGRTGVLTFDPHPVQVLAPDRAPRRILASLEHKEKILADYGVDFLVVMEFTKAFSQQEAALFAEALRNSGVKRLSAGEDWSFGKSRGGTMTRLREWCPEVVVSPVPAVMQNGERISSTRIRQSLRDGNLDAAAQMLGRPYAVYGEVVQGQQLGRTIGFPTANVSLSEELLPANGVYQVEGRWSQSWVRGVANVGVKPTVENDGRRSLEVHFFSEETPASYGWFTEISFLKKIRDEKKFTNLEALKAQIQRDVESASSS